MSTMATMATNQPKILDLLKHINEVIKQITFSEEDKVKQITFSEEDKEVWQIFKDSTECNELKIKMLKLYSENIWKTAFMISPDEFKNLIELFTPLLSKKIGDSNIKEVKGLEGELGGELGGGRRKGLRRKGSRRKRSRRKGSRRKGSRRKGSRSLTGGAGNPINSWARNTLWLFLIPKFILFFMLFLEIRTSNEVSVAATIGEIQTHITEMRNSLVNGTGEMNGDVRDQLLLMNKNIEGVAQAGATNPFELALYKTLVNVWHNGGWNILVSGGITAAAAAMFGRRAGWRPETNAEHALGAFQEHMSSGIEAITGVKNRETRFSG
jgi:hypothetical protein